MRAISGTFRAVLAMACLLPWLASACGGGGGGGGGDDDELPPVNDGPPATITVLTTSAPALIAFRDGTGAAWQTPSAAAAGRYELVVHGPYTVEAVCDSADFTEIIEVARSPDDAREVAMPCKQPTATPPPLHVTGTMTQPAQLALGTAQSVTVGDELQFDLAVHPGTYDLVVRTIAEAGRDDVVVRRDQVITASTRLTPSIDLAREKVSLVEVPLTVTNTLPDDSTVVAGRLTTSTTASALASGSTPSSVRVLADSALRPTDIQSVRAVGSMVVTDGPYRVRFRTVEHLLSRGSAPELALPPVLDTLQFDVVDDQLVARWNELPEYDVLEIAISLKPRILHRKFLSAGYVTATGAASATLDTSVPGYKAAWKIDLAGEYGRKVITTRTRTDGTGTISMHDEDANVPLGVASARQRQAAHTGLTSAGLE